MEGPDIDVDLKSESDSDIDTDKEIVIHLPKRLLKVIGALLICVALIVVLIWGGGEKKTTDRWNIAVKVVEKDTVTRKDDTIGGETVYIVTGEDEEGNLHTFEITDEALEGRFDAETAFTQVQLYRYYRFSVGWRDTKVIDQDGYYPSIYSAKKLLDGFKTDSDKWIIE